MVKTARIYYSGRVQGVGFRYTAERVALSLGVAGWVKNLSDGRVEVFCAGAESDIKAFMHKINDIFKMSIEDVDAEWGETDLKQDSFDIRF